MKAACILNCVLVSLSLLLTLVLAVAGDPASLSNEAALMARVKTIWQAKKDDDWETVYAMADQKFRKSQKLSKFLRGKTMVILDYSIAKVKVDPDNHAKGESMVIFKTIKMGTPMEFSVAEEWLNEDGVWNIKFSDPVTPFDKK